MKRILLAIPNYNNREYIFDAIDSVFAQIEVEVDIVIFDNASIDGVVKELNAKYGQLITIFVNGQNVGAMANHNLCIEYALENKYEFLKIMSSDDVLLPGILEKQLTALVAKPEAVFVTCGLHVTNEDLKVVRTHLFFSSRRDSGGLISGDEMISFAARNLINPFGGPSNLLIRVAKIKFHRFDTRVIWMADLDFFSSLVKGGVYAHVGDVGFYYRQHSATLSSDLRKRNYLKFKEHLWYTRKYNGGYLGKFLASVRFITEQTRILVAIVMK